MSSRALRRLKRKITIEILWLYIARILLEYEPLKAYDIKRKIEERFRFKPSTITVYRVIYGMTFEGLLKRENIGGEILYRLTDIGKENYFKALKLLNELIDKLEIRHSK